MKLFTKIFLQVACVILILSSAVFFYTSYRWKNQSIQYINNYELQAVSPLIPIRKSETEF